LPPQATRTCPHWVTQEDPAPLVYVTFGTVFSNDAVLSTVVEALGRLPVRVVVTVGPRRDPASLGPRPPHVHVARYIPQDQLLGHCAVVVSHAGSGTFLAALAAGLPNLCLPQAADQFLNAQACAASGSGLVLQPGAVTIEAVAGAVERLLADPAFRSGAERVGEEIRGMPAPAEVADRLHADLA
jgi:MGT family glycosyltransferase